MTDAAVIEPTFDADGYPTDETLEIVQTWSITTLDDCEALLLYVQRAWRYPTYFTRHARRIREWKVGSLKRKWSVSTGGWSGNESLISALEANYIFMALCWRSSRRGGHYEYLT